MNIGRNTGKYRFSRQKIVHKVSDSVLVVFTKCENAGIESFFIFLQKQMIEGLPVICEPFLTASVAGRETTPPIATKVAVIDLCGVWSGQTV